MKGPAQQAGCKINHTLINLHLINSKKYSTNNIQRDNMQLLIPWWFGCLLRLNINFLHSMVLVVSFATIYLTVCSLVIKNIFTNGREQIQFRQNRPCSFSLFCSLSWFHTLFYSASPELLDVAEHLTLGQRSQSDLLSMRRNTDETV